LDKEREDMKKILLDEINKIIEEDK